MMTLGLAVMLLIATTRLSKAPMKGIPVGMFKLDKIFLLATAVISAALFINGYDFLDGLAFSAFFVAYIAMAFLEMRSERKKESSRIIADAGNSENRHQIIEVNDSEPTEKTFDKEMLKSVAAFAAGTIGIVFGAGPFIHSMQGFSLEIGVSAIILAVIISPIAGEMPEKISMMILARKGAAGASIAIANVLGSKILNNTLLLAVAIFGAMYHGGFYTNIELTPILAYQVILVTIVTIIALLPLFKKEIGLKVGILLASMYAISLFIQFLLPQEIALH
jgi:cation:H+ antiporter